jgi:hypothetical protein
MLLSSHPVVLHSESEESIGYGQMQLLLMTLYRGLACAGKRWAMSFQEP